MNVDQAHARLSELLPLERSVRGLSSPLRASYAAVLESYLATGRPDPIDAGDARSLAELDLVAIDGDGAVTGAYPFTSTDTGHVVRLDDHEVHAMCSVDAAAIAPVFGLRTRVESRCAATGSPVEIEQDGALITSVEPAEPWLGIRWQTTGGCAATSLCREMVFLADETTAAGWAGDDASVFSLRDGVALGTRFFGPLSEISSPARAASRTGGSTAD